MRPQFVLNLIKVTVANASNGPLLDESRLFHDRSTAAVAKRREPKVTRPIAPYGTVNSAYSFHPLTTGVAP